MNTVRGDLNAWYGRIVRWYWDHDGLGGHAFLSVLFIVIFLAPLCWFFEAGFASKNRLIRPITVLWIGVAFWLTRFFLASHSAVGYILGVLLFAYLVFGTFFLVVFYEEFEEERHWSPWKYRLIFLGLGPIYGTAMYLRVWLVEVGVPGLRNWIVRKRPHGSQPKRKGTSSRKGKPAFKRLLQGINPPIEWSE